MLFTRGAVSRNLGIFHSRAMWRGGGVVPDETMDLLC